MTALAIVQRTPSEREKWKGEISLEATAADKEYGGMTKNGDVFKKYVYSKMDKFGSI